MNVLQTTFCGISFQNPLVLASGILGVTGGTMSEVVQKGAGGVTSKSWWVSQHAGHKNPVIIATENYMLNAVGLPDAGIEKSKEEITEFRKKCDAPFIANIVAGSVEDFSRITEEVVPLQPDMIEVNISCPNVKKEFGDLFSGGCGYAEEMTKAVKQYSENIPVSVKLSPNVSNIADVAKACEQSGANAITAINTVGPGMRIDPVLRKPILNNGCGGVSGPAIFPIAVRCVWEIFEAVHIPIIGTGGITSGKDAIEMMLAGATLLGIGSAVHYRGQNAFSCIAQEMEDFCTSEGIENISECIGAAHKQ
jgi:dihydroorotate dehydrogenase (NAD+) catalytic subunit